MLLLAREGQTVTQPQDILHDPVVLEFAGIETKPLYKESDLEEALYAHLEQFLLELGKGFSFVARQKRLIFIINQLFVSRYQLYLPDREQLERDGQEVK